MSNSLSVKKIGPYFFYKLYCFYFVVHCGSYTKASEHLNIGQPSLSRMIKSLEERLNVCLLHRKGQSVFRLSPEGAQVLSYSKQLVQLLQTLEQSLGLSRLSMAEGPLPTISPIHYSPEHLNKLFKELGAFFSEETVCCHGLIQRLQKAMIKTG